MASTLSLHEAATGSVNRKPTPTTPPADTLGDDDSSSDSSIPSDDDLFIESLKTELLSKKKFVLPAGFLAPLSRSQQCMPSAVEEQDEVVAPSLHGNSSPRVTSSPKRRRSQNDEWKNNSTCSDNSVQPNIAEEINGHSLQKGRHCKNDPVNPESVEWDKNIQSSSEFPSLFLSMKPSYVNGSGRYLTLPAKFSKHHLPDKDTTIILKGENGVEYKTTYISRDYSSRLTTGWRVFSDDHRLAVGDVLHFQLVNQTKFEVSIVKSKHQYEKVAEDGDAIFEKPRRNLRKRNGRPRVTNQRKRRRCVKKVSTPTTSEDGSSSDHSPCSEDSSQLNIPEKGRHCNNPLSPGSLERTKNIQSSSEFPSFSKSMKPSYVTGTGTHLFLPAKFCKHHLPDKNTTIILKGENGVEYKTKYLSCPGHWPSLSAGWRAFYKDHKLAVGDVLRFQLVNPTKFEVFIERSNQSDEVDEALFSKQSASGAKKNFITSDRAEKQKMKLEAKLNKISTAIEQLNGESKKLVKMRESVCHELKMLMRRVD